MGILPAAIPTDTAQPTITVSALSHTRLQPAQPQLQSQLSTPLRTQPSATLSSVTKFTASSQSIDHSMRRNTHVSHHKLAIVRIPHYFHSSCCAFELIGELVFVTLVILGNTSKVIVAQLVRCSIFWAGTSRTFACRVSEQTCQPLALCMSAPRSLHVNR